MVGGNSFIDLAGKLAASTTCDEIMCRTAVSRAYYGTFHLALDFLKELQVTIPRNASAHVVAQRYLVSSGNSDAVKAGRIIADLHSDRIRADYRLDDSRFNIDFARMRVAMAHNVRSTLDACRNDEAKAVIRQGIEEFTKIK
jgi:hypothetical protein